MHFSAKTSHFYLKGLCFNYFKSKYRQIFYRHEAPDSSESETQAVPHKFAAELLFHSFFVANESDFHPAACSGLRSQHKRWSKICQDIKKTAPKEC